MSRPEVRVVALFEDQAHESFLRRLMPHLGLRPVRYVKLGIEVNALRSRNYQVNLGLIIVIDADDPGLKSRIAELEHRVAQCDKGPRGPEERIAYVVPAREIENWYVHLCFPTARPVDEGKDTDYKLSNEWRELKKDLGAAALRAVNAWPSEPGRSDPASMIAARRELDRLR